MLKDVGASSGLVIEGVEEPDRVALAVGLEDASVPSEMVLEPEMP